MDTQTNTRQAAINGLAAIGFLALVGAGMWLAVYSARFVPGALSRVGAAAVSLGSVFVPAPAGIAVVPTASSTMITFGNGTTTPSLPVAPTKTSVATTVTTNPGSRTNTDYQIGGTATPVLSGLPDLVTSITAVGYLTSTSTDSFVAATTVPKGSIAAVQFTIKNVGTNATGAWRFSASIPTSSAYIFQSIPQENLNPNESIDYTLGFDQAIAGTNKMISVSANPDKTVLESNMNNDSASATITILGS